MSQSPGEQQPAGPAAAPVPRLLSENGEPRPPRQWPEGQTLPHYASSVPRVEFRRVLRWAMWRFRETGEHRNLNFTKIPNWAEDFSPFIPPPATYQGPTKPTGRKPGPARPSGERIESTSFWKKSDPFEEPPQDVYDFPEVGMAAQDLQNYLAQYYDLTIIKVLGWGGEGIACLMAYQPPGQPPKYLVVKTPIAADGGDGLMREKQFQGKFQGAQHIMQLYDLRWFEMADMAEFGGAPLQPDLDNPPPPGSEIGPPIMVSEFLSGGSLAKLITALGSKKHLRPVPNYFCWLTWMCMLRSLMEFKYHPKTHPYDVDLGAPTVGMQAETATDNIHFDLDPANYIFGDRGVGWNEDTHTIAPILKMADFGMAETVEHEELQRDPHKLWAFRVRGKYSYWAPEQFSEEWDYVEKLPSERLGASHRVAGKYSWKLNLWQAAQSMVTLMSGMYPESPPLATRMRFTPSLTGHDEHGDIQDPVEFWCYGAYVFDLGPHFDPRLLNVLARCMMENPDERPSLPDLMDMSLNMVFEYGELGRQEGDHQEADWPRNWFRAPFEEQKPWTERQLQVWVEEALYKPIEPPPPVDPSPGVPAASQEVASQTSAEKKPLDDDARRELWSNWLQKRRASLREKIEAMPEEEAMAYYERFWLPRDEKQQEGYRRQKQFKRWLKTRPQSERQEIEQLPQEQHQEAYEKWLAGRVRDENQEKRLTTYVEYREWKRAFDELKALRPNQTPADRYNAWLIAMIKHEAKAPYTEEYIRTCAHEINQYLAYQYQELIAQRNKRAAKRIKEQQQRMRQRGGQLTESDIARINRYYDENVDIYLPAYDSSVAKRIARLQRRLFGEDWHLGKISAMNNPYLMLPPDAAPLRLIPLRERGPPLPSPSPPLSRSPTPEPPGSRLPGDDGNGSPSGNTDDNDDDDDGGGGAGPGGGAVAINPKAPILNPHTPAFNPSAPAFNPNAPAFNPNAPAFNPLGAAAPAPAPVAVAPQPSRTPVPAPEPEPEPEPPSYDVDFPALGTQGPLVPKTRPKTVAALRTVKAALKARKENKNARGGQSGASSRVANQQHRAARAELNNEATRNLIQSQQSVQKAQQQQKDDQTHVLAGPAAGVIQQHQQEQGPQLDQITPAMGIPPPPPQFQDRQFGEPLLPPAEFQNPRLEGPLRPPPGLPIPPGLFPPPGLAPPPTLRPPPGLPPPPPGLLPTPAGMIPPAILYGSLRGSIYDPPAATSVPQAPPSFPFDSPQPYSFGGPLPPEQALASRPLAVTARPFVPVPPPMPVVTEEPAPEESADPDPEGAGTYTVGGLWVPKGQAPPPRGAFGPVHRPAGVQVPRPPPKGKKPWQVLDDPSKPRKPTMVEPPFEGWDQPWLDFRYPKEFVPQPVNGLPPSPKTKHDQYFEWRYSLHKQRKEAEAKTKAEEAAKAEERRTRLARHQQQLRERQRRDEALDPNFNAEEELSPRSRHAFRAWQREKQKRDKRRDEEIKETVEQARQREEREYQEPLAPPSPSAEDFEYLLVQAEERRASTIQRQWDIEALQDRMREHQLLREPVEPAPRLRTPPPRVPLEGSPMDIDTPTRRRPSGHGAIGQGRPVWDDSPPPPVVKRQYWWQEKSPYRKLVDQRFESNGSEDDNLPSPATRRARWYLGGMWRRSPGRTRRTLRDRTQRSRISRLVDDSQRLAGQIGDFGAVGQGRIRRSTQRPSAMDSLRWMTGGKSPIRGPQTEREMVGQPPRTPLPPNMRPSWRRSPGDPVAGSRPGWGGAPRPPRLGGDETGSLSKRRRSDSNQDQVGSPPKKQRTDSLETNRSRFQRIIPRPPPR